MSEAKFRSAIGISGLPMDAAGIQAVADKYRQFVNGKPIIRYTDFLAAINGRKCPASRRRRRRAAAIARLAAVLNEHTSGCVIRMSHCGSLSARHLD